MTRLLSPEDPPRHLVARWIFLRGLGVIFLSAFVSLVPQIRGLIGSRGILPLPNYLEAVSAHEGPVSRFLHAPSLLWAFPTDFGLSLLAGLGVLASVLLIGNVWPRGMIAIATLLFLSFIAVAQDFASYQSDGMLMEAALAAFFLAPQGLRPGLGAAAPPSPAARWFLLWEWFRIYFESGVGKLLSGDPEWRHLTAMDHYYEYGPLPTWPAYYVQQLPHTFHAGTALFTLLFETLIVFLVFVPRLRVWIVLLSTLLQIGIELTANYTFLNLLVLSLGVLFLEDSLWGAVAIPKMAPSPPTVVFRTLSGAVLGLQFYVTVLLAPLFPLFLVPRPLLGPILLLEPFRLTGRYGLFAVMTRQRNEIEFQGSRDGLDWTPYPFRFKPQVLDRAPGIYAPYHPRFEWNLWFASLGPWEESTWVERAEERLLEASPDVLRLFARDPFKGDPPRFVRTVIASYSFTTLSELRQTGRYWRRGPERVFAPVLERLPEGGVAAVESP